MNIFYVILPVAFIVFALVTLAEIAIWLFVRSYHFELDIQTDENDMP